MTRETTDFMSEQQQLGVVHHQRKKEKRRKTWIARIFNDYCSQCSLHGMQYITEEGLSVTERVFWVAVFFVSVGLCGILINNVWIKWNTSPVIVSFNERFIPVGKVPFPSVTICPQIKSKAVSFNFTKHMENKAKMERKIREGYNLTESEIAEFSQGEDIALLCLNDDIYDEPLLNRKFTDSSLVHHLVEVAPNISDTFMQCSWKSKEIECEDVFETALTNEGLCYNFNALASEEIFNKNSIQNDYAYLSSTQKSKNWNLLEGYTKYDPNAYPRRASENGYEPHLIVVLHEINAHKDEMCNSMHSGYKIYVQHPADVPQASLYYYAALPKQVSSLALKFSMISTSENLLNYSPDVRQCYFPSDRPLRYFNTYTASNCLLECLSNYTYEKCGCVSFYMPHNDSQHICTIQSEKCVIDAQDELSINDGEDGAGACKCYPDCHSVVYDAEILKTEFNLNSFIRGYSRLHNEEFDLDGLMEFTKIEFYFKQPRFISMQRSELFGATDFLANCGGLLGLFLGFSFLSLVEILYFLSLRFCCQRKRDARKEEDEKLKELQ